MLFAKKIVLSQGEKDYAKEKGCACCGSHDPRIHPITGLPAFLPNHFSPTRDLIVFATRQTDLGLPEGEQAMLLNRVNESKLICCVCASRHSEIRSGKIKNYRFFSEHDKVLARNLFQQHHRLVLIARCQGVRARTLSSIGLDPDPRFRLLFRFFLVLVALSTLFSITVRCSCTAEPQAGRQECREPDWAEAQSSKVERSTIQGRLVRVKRSPEAIARGRARDEEAKDQDRPIQSVHSDHERAER
jgi:hypothetical protein